MCVMEKTGLEVFEVSVAATHIRLSLSLPHLSPKCRLSIMAYINPYSTATFQTNADDKQACLILWKCCTHDMHATYYILTINNDTKYAKIVLQRLNVPLDTL